MDIQAKIAQTKLFSDAQKVALLAELDSLSPNDQQKLETAINTFNTQYQQLVEKLRHEVGEAIGSLRTELVIKGDPQLTQALADINNGMNILSA